MSGGWGTENVGKAVPNVYRAAFFALRPKRGFTSKSRSCVVRLRSKASAIGGGHTISLPILRSLRGREIVGADISEVSPCFDPTGITCITVANLMFEMLCVIADGIASRR